MTDCIVVGGGIAGMCTARVLAQYGLSVTLVEAGHLGKESSWAGGGILSPLYPWRNPLAITQLANLSQHRYPRWCEQLQQDTGIDPQWVRSGILYYDLTDSTQAQLWARQHHTSLHEKIAQDNAPYVVEPPMWLMPDIAQLRNPRLIKALQADLVRRKVTSLQHQPVTDLLHKRGRIIGVQTTNQRLYASHVIITAGAWSRKLFMMTGIELPIRPIRGQMILLQAQTDLCPHILLKAGHYLIPRQDGKILVGSTVEDVGFDKSTTAVALHTLKDVAIRLLPALRTAPVIRKWAGLRPGTTEDGIPFIAQHPEIKGLYINSGHFRNGIVTSPASAELIASLVTDQKPEIDPHPYRIQGRALFVERALS